MNTDLLHPTVQGWLLDAQAEADRLGAPHIVSGLVVLSAAAGKSAVSKLLRETIASNDLAALREAFDSEWRARPVRHLDEPPTLLREAIELATLNGTNQESAGAFIAVLMSFSDGMAARISRRLGVSPSLVAMSMKNAPG